jgi:hypothetical protein
VLFRQQSLASVEEETEERKETVQ